MAVTGSSVAAEAAPPQYVVAAQVTMPAAGSGVAVDPARGLVYVALRNSNEVVVYDEATLTVQRTIPVPNQPYNIAVGPSGVVYVTEYTGSNVQGALAVIPPGATAVAATLPVGLSPVGVTVSGDGSRLWVANISSAFVSVFDLANPASPAPLPNLPVPAPVEMVAQSPHGSLLYLPNDGTSVFVVGADTGTLAATWAVPNATHQVTFTTDGTQAVVSSQLGSSIPVFSTVTNTQSGTISGANSYYQSQDPELGATFVTLPFTSAGSLAIIDSGTATLSQTLGGVTGAYYTATDATTHRTFVTSITSAALTEVVPGAPTITQNPTPQTVPEGQTATFAAAASGGVAPLTVQWQSSTDGATWTAIPGATSATYTTPRTTLSQSGTLFRAIFTDAAGQTAVSSAAALTVTPVAPTVVQDPASQSVQTGDSVTFTARAIGSQPLTAQWQRSTDAGASWTNIRGATADSYTFTATDANNADQYRAVFTNAAGTATSAAAILTVTAAPTTPTPVPTPPSVASPSPTSSAPTGTGSSQPPSGPRLAATGSSLPPLTASAAALAVLLGTIVLIATRRHPHR